MESFASEFNDADREKIAETLKSKGTKTYLWLHLTLRIMKADPSQYSRRRDVDALLAELPTQVSDAYEKLLSKTTNENITSNLLQIVLAATRRLTVKEANYALTLALEKDGFETHAQLKAGCWNTSFETVVKNFSGLILSIYDDKLSFIHLTAEEYLVQKTEPGSPDTRWGGRFADASFSHALISRCCMKYLLLPELASRLLPLLSTREYPLLEYAANYWPEHFEKQDAISKQSWMQQARRLCKTSEQPLKTWGAVYCQNWARSTFFGWTDLAVAAYLGLSTVVGKMLDDEAVDVNEYSAMYGSALNASIYARENVVAESLISRGADINANVCSSGVLPPLLVAASYNEDIISLLLANGASPLQEFPLFDEETTTVLQSVAEKGLADQFYTLVSTLVDISTPDKVLEALTNETIVHCGKNATTLLFNLLPDEKQEDERLLNQDMLQTLLSDYSTHKRALQLIVEKKRQGILLEPPLLPWALLWQDGRQIVRNTLQELDAPCANITQDVLKDFVDYGDAETLKTLLQYCPEDVCEIGGLLRAANRNWEYNVDVCEVVMDTVGESLDRDEQLQDELLEIAHSPGMLHVFLRLPRCTVQVARRLVQIVLHMWHLYFASNSKEGKHMLARILDHCIDKSNAIDANTLADGAELSDRETFLWLVELSNGALVSKAALLEAAARNYPHGETIIEALMQDDNVMALITPRVVLAAADAYNNVLEWLLEKHADAVATMVEPSPSVDNPEALETLAKRRASEVGELAVAALRMAAEDTGNHNRAIKRLLPYCAAPLVRPSEDFILDLLDGSSWLAESTLTVFVATVGNGIVLTERVLARAASHPRLLEMVRDWRPDEFKVTPSLIAMIAAGGHDESLDYLAKDGLIVGEEWYRLARFRQMVVWMPLEDADALRVLWEEGDIPNLADANGRTAVHAAATVGNTVAIQFLVEVAKLSVDAVDRRGWTALHHAVNSHSAAAVKALLLAGADPHKADYRGRTPVTMAQGRFASARRHRQIINAQKLLAVLNDDGQVEADEVDI